LRTGARGDEGCDREGHEGGPEDVRDHGAEFIREISTGMC
jgi:hypothetical protein